MADSCFLDFSQLSETIGLPCSNAEQHVLPGKANHLSFLRTEEVFSAELDCQHLHSARHTEVVSIHPPQFQAFQRSRCLNIDASANESGYQPHLQDQEILEFI